MDKRIEQFCMLAAALAFLLCLAGGLWILYHVGFDPDDALSTGLGLYFVGKALFVGPMLLLAALQFGRLARP